MLKPRYTLIIVIALFVCITVLGFVFEQSFITRNAQEVSNMVTTASECALKSVTLSDEFFVSGTTTANRDAPYLSAVNKINGASVNGVASDALGLLVNTAGTNSYVRKNVFQYTYNTSTAGTAAAQMERMYNALYNNGTSASDFENWAGHILDAELASPTRYLYWTDKRTSGSGDTATIDTVLGRTRIPKLLTMGAKLFVTSSTVATKVLNSMKGANDTGMQGSFYATPLRSLANGVSAEEQVKTLLNAADYWEYKRESSINIASDDWSTTPANLTYYYTPLSLGLTYIDTNVLNTLFRCNMDLLMRAKYFTSETQISNYSAEIEATSYKGATPAWNKYVINNGEVYYIRGEKSGTEYYADGTLLRAPDVSYMFITLTQKDLEDCKSGSSPSWMSSDDAAKVNAILARAVSPTTTLQSIAKSYTGTEDYQLVLSKVTFYADFIVPYKTYALRGMAKNFGNNAGAVNEASLRCLEISDDLINSISNTYLNTGTAIGSGSGAIYSESTLDSLLDNSLCYAYTTYFAVAA